VEKQSTVSWIRRRVNEQTPRDNLRPNPAVVVTRPITFAVAPPGELTWRLLTTFEHNIAGRRREILTAGAIENRPADGDHAESGLAPRLPVKRKGKTLMFLFQMASLCACFAGNE
jgi:hypothetical protein